MTRDELEKTAKSLLQKYDQSAYFFFTTQGRTALYSVLSCIGADGKEIIVPALTCNTTVVSSIYQSGAKPVFVDIDYESLEMNIGVLERKINKNTIAVISHNYYGYLTQNISHINNVCKEHGIYHIEDCAHNIGVTINNQLSDFRVYSFSKMLPSYSGGCITLDDCSLYERLLKRFETSDGLRKLIKNIRSCDNYYKQMFYYHDNIKYRAAHLFFSMARIIAAQVFKSDTLRVNGNYYTRKYADKFTFCLLDTIATDFQLKRFIKSYKNIESIALAKRELYYSFKDKIPVHTYCTYSANPRYIIVNREDAIKKGYKYVDLWPAFQNYFGEQQSFTTKKIAKTLVGIDLYYYIAKNWTI